MSELDIRYGEYRVLCEVDEVLDEHFNDRTVKQYWVEDSSGESIRDFGTDITGLRDARAFARLAFVYGGVDFPADPSAIPIEFVAEGKPAVAAYLCVVVGLSKRETGQRLDIATSTVTQYLSDYASLQR